MLALVLACPIAATAQPTPYCWSTEKTSDATTSLVRTLFHNESRTGQRITLEAMGEGYWVQLETLGAVVRQEIVLIVDEGDPSAVAAVSGEQALAFLIDRELTDEIAAGDPV